jgi:putative transposase
MDDHVHVIVRPASEFALESIVQSWKTFASKTLVRTMDRQTPIWQSEYYDRILRDQPELDEKIAYVLDNPFRRWLDIKEYEWAGTGTGEVG